MKLVKGCIPLIVATLVLQTPFSYGQAVFGPVDSGSQFVVGPAPAPSNTPQLGLATGSESGNTKPLYVGPIRITETEYVEKLFHLVSIPYAGMEIIQNSCKSPGGGLPESLSSFATASKGFIQAELERDALVKQRTGILQKVSDELIAKKDSAVHLEYLNFQLETMNMNFDAIKGAGAFKLDNSQKLAQESAGLPQLEKYSVKILASIAQNQKDHKDMVDTYVQLLDGIKASGEIAAAACKRKKKVEECSVCEGGGCSQNEEVRTCTIVEKDDPVPGSCEMSALLPPYQNGPVNEYKVLYTTPVMASKALNEGMEKVETQMKTMVDGFPKSNDPEYDWTSPLLVHEKMAQKRKKYGVICPSFDSEEKSEKNTEMNKTAADFMLPLGVGGELGKKAGEMMNANWNVADGVIGQPGNRAEAFSLALKFISEMMQIENSRYQMKLAEYEALQNAIAKLKPQMTGGKAVAECGQPVFGGSAPNPACQNGSGSSGSGAAGGSGAGKVTTPSSGSSAVASGDASSGNKTKLNNVTAKSATGGNLEELPDDNSNIKKIAVTKIGNGDLAPMELSPNNTVRFGSVESGEFVVGPLSKQNMAVATSISKDIQDTTAALKRTVSSQSPNGKGASLVSPTNSNFGGVDKFIKGYEQSSQQIASAQDYKEIARAIGGKGSSINSDSLSASQKILRSTARDLGYSFGGKGTYNGGGNNSSSSSSSTSANSGDVIAAKGPTPAEATEEESSGTKGWQKRAQPIELFDNISNAYKKHGRAKLGLDEIRGENE